jgi:phytoene synthase
MSQSPGDLGILVRKVDFDRFLTSLFASEDLRGDLFALYAFNYEVAKTAESVTQPVMGQIRLQWWREAIGESYAGKPRRHEVALALHRATGRAGLPRKFFDGLIDAREKDLEPAPFGQMRELEDYADATSGHVMRLAARILGAGDRLDEFARSAGIAYAFVGILRAIPFHAARGRVLLPRDHLASAGLRETDIVTGKAPTLRVVTGTLSLAARDHLTRARRYPVRRRFLPALLPAALVPAYLRVMARPDFDVLRESTDLSVARRQLALLAAMMRGRV